MENENECALIRKGLGRLAQREEELARMTIKNGLLALNLGYLPANNIIPRMLDVLGKYREFVEADFVEHSSETPAWMFLKWIN